MSDHVHMLVAIPPKIAVASFMGYLKGKSSHYLDKHANLKYKFGNRKFWSEGYYVSTVGLNEATIAKYIREQEPRTSRWTSSASRSMRTRSRRSDGLPVLPARHGSKAVGPEQGEGQRL